MPLQVGECTPDQKRPRAENFAPPRRRSPAPCRTPPPSAPPLVGVEVVVVAATAVGAAAAEVVAVAAELAEPHRRVPAGEDISSAVG